MFLTSILWNLAFSQYSHHRLQLSQATLKPTLSRYILFTAKPTAFQLTVPSKMSDRAHSTLEPVQNEQNEPGLEIDPRTSPPTYESAEYEEDFSCWLVRSSVQSSEGL